MTGRRRREGGSMKLKIEDREWKIENGKEILKSKLEAFPLRIETVLTILAKNAN